MTRVRNTFLALGAPIAASNRGWLEGYGFSVSYSNFGLGSHHVEAHAGGACFVASSFTLTTYARAFLCRPPVACLLSDTAPSEDNIAVSWSGTQQEFVTASYYPNTEPLEGNYVLHRCTVGTGLWCSLPAAGTSRSTAPLISPANDTHWWSPGKSDNCIRSVQLER